MPLQMVDSNQRLAERQGQGFGGIDPADERARQPGAVGNRHRVNIVQSGARVRQRAPQRGRQVAHVLPRRQLRHHPPVWRVQARLRRDDIRPQLPPVGHNAHGGFIAGSFNPQNQHSLIASLMLRPFPSISFHSRPAPFRPAGLLTGHSRADAAARLY